MAKKLNPAIRDMVAAMPDAKIYYRYSGRLMYGRTCFGVYLDCSLHQLAFFGRLIHEAVETGHGDEVVKEVTDLMADSQLDQLGLGTIIYFPSYDG